MKLFISYSWKDQDVASEIMDMCVDAGVECFLDKKDISWGQSIQKGVAQGLATSTHLLVILSSETVRSWWVPFEIGRAVERGLVILPFLSSSDVDLPSFLADRLAITSLDDLRARFKNGAFGHRLVPVSQTTVDLTDSSPIDEQLERAASHAKDCFVAAIVDSDMNSSSSEVATREYAANGAIVVPTMIELLRHPDARVRYWCAWALVALFAPDHLSEWRKARDPEGHYLRRMREALPGLAGLAALESFEKLVQDLYLGTDEIQGGSTAGGA